MSLDEGLFSSFVRGKFQLRKEGCGCAADWVPRRDEDEGVYVPRPDCSLTTLKIFSIFGGLLGLDHFYLRSPITGLVKMFTLGGAGLWWLWDLIQLFAESDRVLDYGMSAPLDILTGIGQGMITDKTSTYKTNAPFSPWFIGLIFSFVGLDALLANQTGKFMRKFTEAIILIACCIGIWQLVMGWPAGAIVGIIVLSIIGMILFGVVGNEYIIVISIIFSGSLFTTGLQFTKKQDGQVNSTLSIIEALAAIMIPPAMKDQIIKDLQYGGVPVEEIIKMFKIQHNSEYTAQEAGPTGGKRKIESSLFSFFILLLSPFLLLATWVWQGIGLFYPPARIMEQMAATGIQSGTFSVDAISKAVKTGVVPGGKEGVKGFLSDLQQGKSEALGALNPINEEINEARRNEYVKDGKPINDFTRLAGKVGSVFGSAKKGDATTSLPGGLAGAVPGGLQGKVGSLASAAKAGTIKAPMNPLTMTKNPLFKNEGQSGGARAEPLSTEAQVFGAVTVALIGGGVIKGLVDYLITE